MRLLRQDDRGQLVFAADNYNPPPYAILSHTWGKKEEEVSYDDIVNHTGQEKPGYTKLRFIADQAKIDGLEYFWVDTCCINKRDDAELATAIRSMFRWYKESKVCYVYLSDLSVNKRSHDGDQIWEDKLCSCQWFQRGWTLQELIAPRQVEFYASNHQHLGSRHSLYRRLNEVTGIDAEALQGRALKKYPFLTRLSWATNRRTTVPEDQAYSLMGLCGVVMTPLYGEGEQEARRRLNVEIAKRYGENAFDQTPWSAGDNRRDGDGQESLLEQRRSKMQLLEFETMDSRRTTIKKALRQTCSWVLSHPSYLSWREPNAIQEHHGFFWIKGKPGAGKSVLIKNLNDQVSRTKRPQDICISFYFNARGEELEKSLVGMYRSLLVQLMRAEPSLETVLDSARSITGESDSTITELQRLFHIAVLKVTGRQLYCFIDALDECRKQDVQGMIDYFQNLGQEAMEQRTSCHVCFASRHYPTLNILTRLQLVLEDTEEHEGDLRKYVQSQKFSVPNSAFEKIPISVQNDILEKANHVFLWVVLVIEILRKEFQKGRIHAVRKRLATIPQGLSKLFREIVQRDREDLDEFLLCLKWILYAKRPLTLKEFYYAMMAADDENQLQWNSEISDNMMHGFLLSSSKGLAELTKSKPPRAQFIHESVREFLITEEGFQHIDEDHCASAGQIHDSLQKCCLRGISVIDDIRTEQQYLLVDGQDAASPGDISESHELRTKLTARYPFMDYAVNFLFYHSDQAAQDVPQWDFVREFDISDWTDKANILQKHKVNLYQKPVDLGYILAERDHANLLLLLADHGYAFESHSLQRYTSPLLAAFAHKSKNAARVLLEHDGAVDPNEIVQDVIVDNYKGKAVYARPKDGLNLQWAVEEGYQSLARHLLRKSLNSNGVELKRYLPKASSEWRKEFFELLQGHDEDINFQSSWCSIALESASLEGNEKAVTLLLDRGAEINMQGGQYGTALHAASYSGHKEVVALLLDRGAEINRQGGRHGTALQAASSLGRKEVVALLLDRGAEINMQGGQYGTALQAASFGGYNEVVALLLDRGAEINMQGGSYGNALYAASSCGRKEVVALLLDRGAKINMQGSLYGTALYAASFGGHKEVVALLLDRGAETDTQGGQYGTALQAASFSGYEEVVALLLDCGAEINLKGGRHVTALHAASDSGHKEVVALLLDRGAVINAQGGRRSTALQAASSRGHKEVVALLLDRKADINAQGGRYGTALQAASYRGHEEVVALLLERGAESNKH